MSEEDLSAPRDVTISMKNSGRGYRSRRWQPVYAKTEEKRTRGPRVETRGDPKVELWDEKTGDRIDGKVRNVRLGLPIDWQCPCGKLLNGSPVCECGRIPQGGHERIDTPQHIKESRDGRHWKQFAKKQ